jgi:hypothetical protein
MSDRPAPIRDYALRDLVQQLDEALFALELYDVDENDKATIKCRDLFRAERALEAAADYLHELRLEGSTS